MQEYKPQNKSMRDRSLFEGLSLIARASGFAIRLFSCVWLFRGYGYVPTWLLSRTQCLVAYFNLWLCWENLFGVDGIHFAKR